MERAYEALLGVVQTTAVSRKVLARPPFTFLHKLLVETLGDYDLFSDEQLQFSALNTKQAKAAFLTRAIAFVTLAMSAGSDHPHISCLLLVSPVQVLAGVSVSDTLEFLLQLCEVCKMPSRDIKEAAAREVRQKGDAQLYASGVAFRKGLVLIQGIIRSFLKRRVRKASTQLSGVGTVERAVSMTEGTRFLKELADGRIYNGVIRSVQNHTYVLGYEEDAEAEDKVDGIEMKIILEESQRLYSIREAHRRLSRSDSNERADGDISLTALPDLTATGRTSPHAPGFIKRVSSRDSGVALLVSKPGSTNMLKRAQSQRPSMSGGLFRPGSGESVISRKGTDNQQDAGEIQRRTSKNGDWQSSLKKMLAEGRDQAPPTSVRPEVNATGSNQKDDTARDRNAAQVPNFPKLGIPGTKPLAPIVRRSSNGSLPTGESKKPARDQSVDAPAPRAPPQRSDSLVALQRVPSTSIPSPAPTSEGHVDAAFTGPYQTTDQRTQEKLALIRDIVLRIDMYMKRKRLRVIDLFRFCDADGNGSISPEEMIDTLSQMEIQLTPDQAREFLEHIDKDGNGSIDVDEFEELVRVSRRNEAQREQVKKELSGSRKSGADGKSSGKSSNVMKAKAKQRILEAFNAAQEEGGVGVSAAHLRSIIGRLSLPGVSEVFINDLVDRAAEIATGKASLSSPFPSSAASGPPSTSPNSKLMISYQQLAKALDELEWTKKSNRFLNQAWLRHFDSQLERAIREFELL